VNPGSRQTFGHACVLISQQSAATSAPNSCTPALLPITFTLSRLCHALLSQAQLIEQIKQASSKWIKAIDTRYRGVRLAARIGAFSVRPSQLDAVLQYIQGQKEHHRARTFQEEYRVLLRKHGVDFNERMCGIENTLRGIESHFQRCEDRVPQVLGRCPRLRMRTHLWCLIPTHPTTNFQRCSREQRRKRVS
jgi:hypothetical protein